MVFLKRLHLVTLLCSILLSCKEAPFEKAIVGDWKSLNINNAGDSVIEKMTFKAASKWESETIVSGKAYNHTNGNYEITSPGKYLILRVDSIEETMGFSEAHSAGNDSTVHAYQENKMVKADTSFKYEIMSYGKDYFELKDTKRRLVFRYRRLLK